MRAVVTHSHPLARIAISYLLRSRFGNSLEIDTVRTHEGLMLAIEFARERGTLGLVVVDTDLTGASADAITYVVQQAGEAPVAALIPRDRPDYERAAMGAGAAIVIFDDRSPEGFVAEIERVCRIVPVTESAVASWRPQDIPLTPGAGDSDEFAMGPEEVRRLLPLTGRQRDILDCLRLGMSNKQIARDLGISHSTVKVHVRNVLDRLGVDNRVQAALLGRADFGLQERA